MTLNKDYSCLFFTQCILCHDPCHRQQGLCEQCISDLPWIRNRCPRCALPQLSTHLCHQCQTNPPPFESVIALFDYHFPLNQLIAQTKYHNKPGYLAPLARLFADHICNNNIPDLLIPVPMHPHRLKERGYNQAEILTQLLGTMLNIPVDNRLLHKTKSTAQQMSLSREDRVKNLKGVFSASKPTPEHIVIVDDVMTTGTTMREICNTLRSSPQQRIDVWVLVRTAKER